jgi:HTH-type transcriptional repressor of NAD biosynthesis genes
VAAAFAAGRGYGVIRVCLFGPESTGKSTLAKELAAHFHTIAVPEYGRIYCEIFGNECDAEDLLAMVRGQHLLEEVAERKAKRLIVLDTDAVMTAVWSDVLLGNRLPELDGGKAADFYLLTNIDVPFVQDAIRYFPNQAGRQRMFDLCKAELERRALPYVTISGSREERLKIAINAINARFPELSRA